MITAENDTLFFVLFVDKYQQHDVLRVWLSRVGLPHHFCHTCLHLLLVCRVPQHDDFRAERTYQGGVATLFLPQMYSFVIFP